MSQKRLSPRQRALRTGLSIGMAAGSIGGAVGMNAYKNAEAHGELPACAIPAEPGETIGVVSSELAEAGSSVGTGEASIVASDGHRRSRDTDPLTPDGSVMIQNKDTLRFSHVKPQVCVALGGQVEGLVTTEPVQDPVQVSQHGK